MLWLVACVAAGSAGRTGAAIPFDFPVARTHLYAAFSAYCGTDVDASMSCFWCKDLTERAQFAWTGNFGDSHGAAFGFVGCLNTSTIEVVFRGTDNIKGWIEDADFTQTPFNGSDTAKVHLGFWKTYSVVAKDVRALVDRTRPTCGGGKDIVVTGHSLGAALATLGAVEIAGIDPSQRVQLFTFGQPRVGNKGFAELADEKLVFSERFTHRRDIIPHMPFKALDYWHVSREYWQNTENQYVKCNDSGEDPNCSDSVIVTNPLDHATYLGVDILAGVLHRCLYTDP